MARRRFYVPADTIRDGRAILPPSQAHHLRDVLRIDAGEIVEIFDGAGSGYAGEVVLQGSDVVIRGLQSLPSERSRIRLILAAALIKPARFEWVLQKATELGAHEIIPLKTRLSDKQIPDSRLMLRMGRWDRLVKEASKQCRRLAAPRVHAPRSFPDFLVTEEFSACTKLLFHEKAAEPYRSDPNLLSDPIVLCIGPEGGWEDGEIRQAKEAGCEIFHMGPWILRAETAAIAALSIVQHQILLQKIQIA